MRYRLPVIVCMSAYVLMHASTSTRRSRPDRPEIGDLGAEPRRPSGALASATGRQRSLVPKEEAEQVVEILKKNGRTVDVHYYPNEGHGFEKRENQIDAIQRGIAWFDRYLMGKNAAQGEQAEGHE